MATSTSSSSYSASSLMNNSNSTTTAASESNVPLGLIVTARQKYYPIELSNSELLSHYETVQEYQNDIAATIIQQSNKCNPSTKLINQQPELNPLFTRHITIGFLYKLAQLTRVTNGIFFQATRLFDRYCSKRIVLRDQINLILGTCLWLAAKTFGGCNHIINNVVVPTGGRFYGPNPRARIPRLNELVYYCNNNINANTNPAENTLDESMFLQMERHILDTLNWEVYEPSFNDYLLNVDENCLIQYELYQRQTLEAHGNNMTPPAANSNDSELNDKIQLIHLKKFLMDLTSWQYELLNFELFEITSACFDVINKFTNEHDQSSLLELAQPSPLKQYKVFNILINAIVNAPEILLDTYKEHSGIVTFINNVKLYVLQTTAVSKTPSSNNRISINTSMFETSSPSSTSSIPSPIYSANSTTPLRNVSGHSDNSIFSTIIDTNSPITPSLYHKNESAWDSTLSVISNKRQHSEQNKENIMPPRSKFLNTGSNNSSKTSLISLTIGQGL
ncbi:cyclin CLN2 KNAG_0D00630 [Huiozyma naganishii CBS 8797]|uniref:G1/S-specific cyclin n=1 Tax=Huiozyma naganishii (strain ATCC MYA-139 / BCRC 22969 / CBS 8797 / KCTC 17520 / NBRC 10181 / NCYC 3082 / Yp74L-3) TaxID=1071383 RepID=J7R4P4_HUIN7|nr:hypothetical protein KNAG_0D00630 [Kazachstania naganishii CBS 8797]CCK69815.1 hypothetical protein KNAG_0D00630 [Kazachstania naganishii CBS 8797]